MDRAKERTKWKCKWRKSSNANWSWSVNSREKNRPKNRKQHTALNKSPAEKRLCASEKETPRFLLSSLFQLKDFNRLALTLQSQLPLWFYLNINSIDILTQSTKFSLPSRSLRFSSISIHSFAVVLLALLLLLCHCSISASKAWE